MSSHIALRRAESQSERFLDVSKYETLRRGLEAVYGPYMQCTPHVERCMRNAEVRGLRMQGRGHGEVEHRTGRVLTSVNSLCRNHTSEAVFEREGKSVATEQGAGVEGCDPAHPHEAHRPRTAGPPFYRYV